jgi:hypothetical protein
VPAETGASDRRGSRGRRPAADGQARPDGVIAPCLRTCRTGG